MSEVINVDELAWMRRNPDPSMWTTAGAKLLLAALAEREAEVERSRAAFADWLVQEVAYPINITFEVPPPLSRRELAEAWHRADSTETIDTWLWLLWDILGGETPGVSAATDADIALEGTPTRDGGAE